MNLETILPLMIFATLLGALGSLLLKKGSVKFELKVLSIIKNWQVILGLFLYVLASIIFIWLLKTSKLSFLYPFTALSYVWVSFLSVKILKEKMNSWKWVGILLIIAGIVLITL